MAANAIDLELGSSEYITYPYDADLNITSGDFTVECWFKPESQSYYNQLVGTYDALSNNGYVLYISDAGDIYFGWYNGGWYRAYYGPTFADTALSNGTWYHIAGVFDDTANTLDLYINGVAAHQTTSVTTNAASNEGNGVIVGYWYSTHHIDGVVQNARISTGKRYTANFTPSTNLFKNDANTLFLCTFNDTLDDISDNALTGTYNGSGSATYVAGTLNDPPTLITSVSLFGYLIDENT
jgi:hypothetical protein